MIPELGLGLDIPVNRPVKLIEIFSATHWEGCSTVHATKGCQKLSPKVIWSVWEFPRDRNRNCLYFDIGVPRLPTAESTNKPSIS